MVVVFPTPVAPKNATSFILPGVISIRSAVFKFRAIIDLSSEAAAASESPAGRSVIIRLMTGSATSDSWSCLIKNA